MRRRSQTHGSLLVSRARTSSASIPSTEASCVAALSGSPFLTVGGMAYTDWTSTEVASRTPLMSRISPRSAGISSFCASWFSAIAATRSRSTTCQKTSRPPTRVASMAVMTSRNRARARLSVLASTATPSTGASPRPITSRGLGQSISWRSGRRLDRAAPAAARSAPSPRSVLGERATPIWIGELLLLGAQVGDPRLETVDLVAERGDMGRLAQVEEAQAGGGRDRDQHGRDAGDRSRGCGPRDEPACVPGQRGACEREVGVGRCRSRSLDALRRWPSRRRWLAR